MKRTSLFLLIILFGFGLLLRNYFPEVITETFCTTFVLLAMYFTFISDYGNNVRQKVN